MHTQRRDLAKNLAGRRPTADAVRRVAIATAGFLVLIFGVALLVVPVPGTSVVVIPLGLAILAREFTWARRLLVWSAATVTRLWAGVRRRLCRSFVASLARRTIMAGDSLKTAVIAG